MFVWTGWGIVALPVLIVGVFGGMLAAHVLFPGLAEQDNHSGLLFGGGAAGLVASGGAIYLLGLAFNRHSDWTADHTIYNQPMERAGLGFVFFGVLALPFALVDFVPTQAVWWVFGGWAALVLTVTIVLAIRREKQKEREREARSAR
jgi:hypothetical protein